MKFATKSIRQYPSHLRRVAALPWKIKNSNFLQMWKKTPTNCILITSGFVIHPQILIFSAFKTANLFFHKENSQWQTEGTSEAEA